MWIPGKQGYGSVADFADLSGTYGNESVTELLQVQGIGSGVHNSHKFREGTKGAVPAHRALWYGVYRTHRGSGYVYEFLHAYQMLVYGNESLTELIETPGLYCGTDEQNLQKFLVRVIPG